MLSIVFKSRNKEVVEAMHDAKIQPSLCRRPTAPHRKTLLRPNKSSRLDEADLW